MENDQKASERFNRASIKKRKVGSDGMSTEAHKTKSKTRSEHGTTKSYVVGYILSLVFTFIPFYLVMDEVVTGSALEFTILSIAVLQMIIQIVFFLHLGRGPKPLYNVVFFVATVGIIVMTIGASLFIMKHLYHNMSTEEVTLKVAQEENISQLGGEETGACNKVHESHIVTIKDGKASPIHITAQRCDSLTFINEDSTEYVFMFGPHNAHISYGGDYEIVLDDGRPETINLNQTGDFEYHNEQNTYTSGHFTVEP